MRRVLAPKFVSGVIPFSYATSEWLEKTEQPGQSAPRCTIGQCSKDGKWAWLANGNSLEVVCTQTGHRLGAWSFGASAKMPHMSVTCVSELNCGNSAKLLVGLECGSQGGFVAVFDIRTSKIIKGIEIPHQVTSVEVVSARGGVNIANHILHKCLRYMFGVAAVGTVGGHLYLLDLCLDDGGITNEINPAIMCYMKADVDDLPYKREEAIAKHVHLTLPLHDDTSYRHFQYFSTSNESIASIGASDVSITSLRFFPQIMSLAVGYSFGSFHLWNVNTLTIEHSSAFDFDQLPVVHFLMQEPENDPRNFCYLWVVRGLPACEVRQDQVTSIMLYALVFANRSWLHTVGNVYQNLETCTSRFEYDLMCDPYSSNDVRLSGSRLIGCYTSAEHAVLPDESCHDEGGEFSDLSLMVVAWEAWPQESLTRSCGFIGVFDLNQWYQAHMPNTLRVGGVDLCPFFGFYSLEEVMDCAVPDFLLHVKPVPRSIAHFQSTSTSEHQAYPSSLSFDTCCLIETGIIHSSYYGIQRQILSHLKTVGPTALVEPRDAFNLCVFSGLISRSVEASSSNMSLQTFQREAILTLALENGLLDFVIACVVEWTKREFSSVGCSLRFIMDWAWRTATQIKSSLDRLCLPLYSCSGLQLDPAKVKHLHHSGIQLRMLITVFQHLLSQSTPTTEQGIRELDTKMNLISLIHTHHLVVLWCYEGGILPEHEENEDLNDEEFCYAASLLKEAYIHRRSELQRINNMIRSTDLLLIDGVISHIGEPITTLWEKDGGTGLYPPPSLYALLNIYLLTGVSLVTKHRIVQYLFLDIAACLPEHKDLRFLERLTSFSAAFSVSPSISKLTHAFWLLDHKDFEGALSLLMDPVIRPTDIESWQNTLIIKSFLYQKEHQKALKYCNARQPAMVTPEDMKLRLTVLLSNGLIAEAFQFQRECRDNTTADDLLNHFFLACQQTKSFGSLFQLPLSSIEEDVLVQFLQESVEPFAQEMLVVYYLQRSRFAQALTLNSSLKTRVMNNFDPASRERASTRNVIVDGFASVLPKVQQKLAQNYDLHLSRNMQLDKEVCRPQPLSTFVKPSHLKITTQSTLIKAVIDKVTEASLTFRAEEFSPLRTRSEQRRASRIQQADNLPFIGTPHTPKTKTTISDACEVVYPSLCTRDADFWESSMEFGGSPTKRSRYMDINPTKRRMPKFANAELMSMLQTPPVRRKTPRPPSVTANVAAAAEDVFLTPHSILKVRNIVQTGSPHASHSPVVVHEPIVAAARNSMLRYRDDSPNMEYDGDANLHPDTLQKQLRFELSDSPSSSPEMRILHDRFTRETPDRETLDKELSSTPVPESEIDGTSARNKNGDVVPTPRIQFRFQDPVILESMPLGSLEANDSTSASHMDISPRRPLHMDVNQPVLPSSHVVYEPDSTREPVVVTSTTSVVTFAPVKVCAPSEPVATTRTPPSLWTQDDVMHSTTTEPMTASESFSSQDDMAHLNLESSDSASEAEPPVAKSVFSKEAVYISECASSNSPQLRPMGDVWSSSPLPPAKTSSPKSSSMPSATKTSLSSKFSTPSSMSSSPSDNLVTARSRFSGSSSIFASAPSPCYSSTTTSEVLVQELSFSDDGVQEHITGVSTVKSEHVSGLLIGSSGNVATLGSGQATDATLVSSDIKLTTTVSETLALVHVSPDKASNMSPTSVSSAETSVSLRSLRSSRSPDYVASSPAASPAASPAVSSAASSKDSPPTGVEKNEVGFTSVLQARLTPDTDQNTVTSSVQDSADLMAEKSPKSSDVVAIRSPIQLRLRSRNNSSSSKDKSPKTPTDDTLVSSAKSKRKTGLKKNDSSSDMTEMEAMEADVFVDPAGSAAAAMDVTTAASTVAQTTPPPLKKTTVTTPRSSKSPTSKVVSSAKAKAKSATPPSPAKSKSPTSKDRTKEETPAVKEQRVSKEKPKPESSRRSRLLVQHLGTPVIHGYNTRLRSRSPESVTSSPSRESDKVEAQGHTASDAEETVGRKPPSRTKTRPSTSTAKQKSSATKALAKSSSARQKLEFSFSPPVVLATPPIPQVTPPNTEVKPFVFSPPLTRSRTRRGKRPSETDSVTSEAGFNEFELNATPSAASSTTANRKKVKGKKSLARSRRSLQSEVVSSDSPINFVSPIAEEEKIVPSSSVRRSQRSTQQRRQTLAPSRKKKYLW